MQNKHVDLACNARWKAYLMSVETRNWAMKTKKWIVTLYNGKVEIERRMLAIDLADIKQIVSNDDSLDGFKIVSMVRA